MAGPDRDATDNAAAFNAGVDDVFGRIAARYDLLCDIFSFGIHRLWKRRVAQIIASHDWLCMLDAASGTGHIVSRVVAMVPDAPAPRHIILTDLSAPMLAMAQRNTAATRHRLDYRISDAQDMAAIASDSVDLYSISLGLKICDRARVMTEAYRLLRPGGRFVALEASAIVLPALHRLYLIYMDVCMPLIGRIATGGDASAYLYLLKGVHDFPDAEQLAAELREIGFEDVQYERLSLGIVAIHCARKPTAGKR